MLGVVGHESRRDQADALANKVSADYLSVDDGTLGCEGNHRHVWQTLADRAAPGDRWAVVLEDDAMPIPAFGDQLARVLDAAPTSVVCLYLGRGRPPQFQDRIARATARADDVGAHWLTHTRVLHCVGLAVKTRLVPDMVASTVNAGGPRGLPIDESISAWARHSRLLVAYPWPSLVDHADGPTVAFHRDRAPRDQPRTAWATGSRRHWSTQTVAL